VISTCSGCRRALAEGRTRWVAAAINLLSNAGWERKEYDIPAASTRPGQPSMARRPLEIHGQVGGIMPRGAGQTV
jgi:hypothetical protein